MISRSLILQILQAAKIMRRFYYEAPAEIMRIYTTTDNRWMPFLKTPNVPNMVDVLLRLSFCADQCKEENNPLEEISLIIRLTSPLFNFFLSRKQTFVKPFKQTLTTFSRWDKKLR